MEGTDPNKPPNWSNKSHTHTGTFHTTVKAVKGDTANTNLSYKTTNCHTESFSWYNRGRVSGTPSDPTLSL